ncbi:uncharacterized protein METZ01_LOCUS6134, partial [marine metagenome]
VQRLHKNSHRLPFKQVSHRYRQQEGLGRSSIVWRPGEASMIFGIEFTAIDAVAMSPGTPPIIFIAILGEPVMLTESYDS